MPAHLLAHRLAVEGLGHVIFGAAFNGVHGRFNRAKSSHDEDRQIAIALVDLLHDSEPVAPRHHQVQQNQRQMRIVLARLEGLHSGGGDFDRVALPTQEIAQGFGQVDIIVHHQDLEPGHPASACLET